jgi:hypothetical protein
VEGVNEMRGMREKEEYEMGSRRIRRKMRRMRRREKGKRRRKRKTGRMREE